MSRLSKAESVEIISADRPFSNFEFVEQYFQGSFPIRRLFSQARSHAYRTIVLEKIHPHGAVQEEVDEIKGIFQDYKLDGLYRVSFWKNQFDEASDISEQCDQDCLGFALLKRDQCSSISVDRWHVFESVIEKYQHQHNYSPLARQFEFRIHNSKFKVSGVLYAEQNGLNKCCAHVAIRSICSTYLGRDVSYGEINHYASEAGPLIAPGKSLTTKQITKVLDNLGVSYNALSYKQDTPLMERLKFQKILYSGIESGCGALLGFDVEIPQGGVDGHIIPLFGHTFNEDTWAPNAIGLYFQLSQNIRYIPSDSWLSSFLAHDDNLGSNLCIPKNFLDAKKVSLIIALRPHGYCYPAYEAEMVASIIFYSILDQLPRRNIWIKRLASYVQQRKLILRTVPNDKDQYTSYFKDLEDWKFNKESENIVDAISQFLPNKLWVIEVGIPDLFSTNKRKLGELLLDATMPLNEQQPMSLFVMARLPGCYVFLEDFSNPMQPKFSAVKSNLTDHTHVQKMRPRPDHQ